MSLNSDPITEIEVLSVETSPTHTTVSVAIDNDLPLGMDEEVQIGATIVDAINNAHRQPNPPLAHP